MASIISGFSGKAYSATFSAVAITAAQDVFEITAGSSKRVSLKEFRIGQYTDFGDAAAEILSLLFIRDYTVSGSGGAAVTPSALCSQHGACSAVVERNNTTVANTGSPLILIADAWNIQAPYLWIPEKENRITLEPSERLVIRITAPADSITTNGTLIFEEG